LLELEFPALKSFDDPSLEWRRLFSETFGTFLLVLVAPAVASSARSATGRSAGAPRSQRPG